MIKSGKFPFLLCCLCSFIPQRSVVEADFFQHMVSVRSLPSVILKDSIPIVHLSRRRQHQEEQQVQGQHSTQRFGGTMKRVTQLSSRLIRTSGYYYGLPQEFVTSRSKTKKKRKESLDAMMSDALAELRVMRQEMIALRQELKSMKRQIGQNGVLDEDDVDDSHADELSSRASQPLITRIRKQREWDRVGLEIEQWAERLLFQEDSDAEENGWKEIKCSKLCSYFNKDSRTKCYVKWMRDSRGSHATTDDNDEYPCMKAYATLDAPIDQVCAYLADSTRFREYNDLVVNFQDLEEISPHSKICWGQSPKILFVQPRNFVTFCHHRWLRDGTQVVVNQACNYEEYSQVIPKSNTCPHWAFALRGANFISPHPDDPNKTRFALIAHANPGHDISPWMCRLAVNNLVPIEPFKLFHKINKHAQVYKQSDLDRTQMVKALPGRSNRPAGMSQMGYACFWPNGGGLKEGLIHSHHPDHVVDPFVDEDSSDDTEALLSTPEPIQVGQ